MTTLETMLPAHPLLRSVILSYGQIRGDSAPAKTLSPRTSATLIIQVEGSVRVDETAFPSAYVAGLREHPVNLNPEAGPVDRIQVKFTPWGLGGFTTLSPKALKERSTPAQDVFPVAALTGLLEGLTRGQSLSERVGLLDRFFLKLYSPPSPVERAIQELAALLYEDPARNLGEAFQTVFLSPRQIERRFGRTTGLSPRSFQRIVRFERAKDAVLNLQNKTLGEIGIDSGYYDQAHFNREFKTLSTVPPGSYSFCAPPVPTDS